ncbi:MAG: hypothetical protein ACK5A2_09370 [Bacteroidota bacterium]|jgi:hypothetical protein
MAEESLKIVLTADNKQAIAAMKETVTSLNHVDSAAGNTGGKVVKMGKDFTGLSRVIQDLPYGFNAISNNLTQLVPAAGAAGLAFSALVAGLSFAQIGLSNWTRGSKEADEAMQASTKALTEFNVQLQNSKNDFAAVRAGVLSKKEALDRYNDTLGKSVGYAKSIEEAEALMVKNTATVVQAMNLRTQAQLFQAKSAELTAKLTTGEIYNLSLMEQALVGIKGSLGGLGNVMKVAGQEMSTRFTDANAQIKQFDKLSQDALTKAIELEKGLAGTRTAPTNVGGTKVEKPKVQSLKEENAELERQIQAYKNLKFAMMGQGTIMPEKEKGKELTNLKLTTEGNSALNQVMLQRNQIEEQRIANLELANNLTNTAMNSLNGLANAMMNGQNIGQALGDMFKRLAIDIALAAAKAAIFQAILSAVSGGTAGAAGKGGFLKGFGKLLGFAEGGTVSGPRSGYPVMLHGTEHIVRPDQMRSIIASASQMGGGNSRVVVEGVVRGNDIWLSQSRTNTFRALTT